MSDKMVTISARFTPELRQRLTNVAEQSGMSEANIVRACVKALVEHYEEHGYLCLPFEVRPKYFDALARDRTLRVAESRSEYVTKKKRRLPPRKRSE